MGVITMEYKSKYVQVQTDSKNDTVGNKMVLMCQKHTTKEIERMLLTEELTNAEREAKTVGTKNKEKTRA